LEVEEGMRAQSKDTDLRAEAVQIDLLRHATVARRTAIALALSEQMIGLARRAIRRRFPQLGEREVLLKFVSLHYGPDIAEGLAQDLMRRSA
jgi:hypothetical protein